MHKLIFFLSLITSVFFVTSASSSSVVDCNVKLKMYNKLIERTKFRRFNGKVDVGYLAIPSSNSADYQQLEHLKSGLCRPNGLGYVKNLPGLFSAQFKRPLNYVGSVYYDTGKFAGSDPQLASLEHNLPAGSGVVLVGRSSKAGHKTANLHLSFKRAFGIAERLSSSHSALIIALGDEQTTEELNDPRHDNRRVDIFFFE